jgi:hypothetical protein
VPVNLHTTHFRFGVDELAESTHGWYANADTNPAAGVIPLDTVFLLRFTVQETGATLASNVDNQFQFSINGAAFADLTTTSVGPRAVAAAALTNGGNCTKRLTGTGTFETTGAGQTEDGLSGGNANDIAASGNSETECGIIIDSADVVNGDVITFRLTSPDFTITNDIVPTVTVQEAVPYSADLSAPSFAFSAQSLTRFNDYVAALTAPAFAFTAAAMSWTLGWTAALSAPAMQMTAYALDVVTAVVAGSVGWARTQLSGGINMLMNKVR